VDVNVKINLKINQKREKYDIREQIESKLNLNQPSKSKLP
jgi:hypothetical protein